MTKEWVIYKITNPVGAVYIGRTCNFNMRIAQYRTNNCKKQLKIYNSLVKYGFSSHSIEIIDSFSSDVNYMKGKERFWIKTYMSYGSKYSTNGLNCSEGGDGASEKFHSEESRKKMSETKKRNPKVYTQEMRDAMSKRMKGHKYNKPGKKAPEGWVEKMRMLHTGNKYNLGRKHSPESIKKRVEKTRGRKLTDNVRAIFIQQAQKISRSVLQYDKDGVFIKEYPSITEAANIIGCHRTHIGSVVMGHTKTVKGFIFKYKDGSTPEFKPKRIPLSKEEKNRRKLAYMKKRYMQKKRSF